jgi:peptidoglycan/LPS O-acetylase OafA/YrhL
MAAAEPAPRIHALDGLRGWLALYVAIYHLAAPLTGPDMALAPIRAWLGAAWWTVDMFFLMSGFVMMHVYQQVFTARLSTADAWRFMKARFARLYPVHLLALLLMLPGFLRMPDHVALWLVDDGRFSADAFVKSLLMLHGPWMEDRSWNYPAWSISAEWHAYLVFPLLAWLLGKASTQVWGSARARALAGWATVLCCVPPLVLYVTASGGDVHPTNGAVMMWRALPLFIAGMLCRMQLPCDPGSTNLRWVPWLTMVLLFGPLPELAVLACPAVLCWALSRQGDGWGLSAPLSLWLGKVSYSLYMTHALVEMYVVQGGLRLAVKWGGVSLSQAGLASAALLALALSLALVFAALAQHWVEEPCRKAILRWRWPTRAWA